MCSGAKRCVELERPVDGDHAGPCSPGVLERDETRASKTGVLCSRDFAGVVWRG